MKRIAIVLMGAVVPLAFLACSDEAGPAGAAADADAITVTDSAVAADSVLDSSDPQDTPVTPDVVADTGEPPLDTGAPGACNGGCVAGLFCDTTTDSCVECLVNDNCAYPKWCDAGTCVETACFPNQKLCDANVPKQCKNDGSAFVEDAPCAEGASCVFGECKEKVCQPGEKHCDLLQIQVCDEWGTGFTHVACPPGSACYTEQCEPIKHNVVLIFDTSGSMGSLGALDAVPCICPEGCKAQPYPACEDINCPQSRLGLAKNVFNEIFVSPIFKKVNFAMLRFPQREKADSAETCASLFDPTGVGHYTNSDWITGDDNSHIAPDGSWFDHNLHEILSVRFPLSVVDDTTEEALEWVDGNEVFEKLGVPCEKNVDCAVGVCAINKQTGEGECATHTNHELRAGGGTPLGKSLFYAGEYIRKYGVVEGKPCEADSDCGNVNYYCGPEKTCFDPLRGCRQNIVILFTDGVESPETQTTDFFNPIVQAKRLHHGLGCAFHSDCMNGAKCKNATCQEYGAGATISLIDGTGANRLNDYTGKPIAATVHVVDISIGGSESKNSQIAQHGGGIFYPVQNGDPSQLLGSINSILDVKANLQQCIPSFPEGWGE